MSISICKYCDKHFDEDYEAEHEEVCRENINFRKETMKKQTKINDFTIKILDGNSFEEHSAMIMRLRKAIIAIVIFLIITNIGYAAAIYGMSEQLKNLI